MATAVDGREKRIDREFAEFIHVSDLMYYGADLASAWTGLPTLAHAEGAQTPSGSTHVTTKHQRSMTQMPIAAATVDGHIAWPP
ncbi:hypothetical protein GCM10009038_22600 [Salinicola rhizosphaerae]|uniref:Uncharacterized protein n=1 Tax=Salinicola rhizosphaerae TaxID=1443141 RepID=A0ABQ3E779_9GAMM|nr:hypothetical protein GCM10009038_22600 [Salinicola rhizosphaerae]